MIDQLVGYVEVIHGSLSAFLPLNTVAIDRFHSHSIKKNKSKTIQLKKLRNCDVIEDN